MTVDPDRCAARRVVHLDVVDSTQAVAFALATEGAPDGTTVIADTQTRGRGRRGRAWYDEPGASLLASIILRPRLDPAAFPLLSLVAGIAVVGALWASAGLDARLKWPNDVLVRGRKIAGILIESRRMAGNDADRAPALAPGTRGGVVVVGIGINLTQRRFPPPLDGRATSALLEIGRLIDRDRLLAGVLDGLDRWRARLEAHDFASVRDRWRAIADTLGKTVSVDGIRGVAIDLDQDGALVVDDGHRRHRVVAGEVA